MALCSNAHSTLELQKSPSPGGQIPRAWPDSWRLPCACSFKDPTDAWARRSSVRAAAHQTGREWGPNLSARLPALTLTVRARPARLQPTTASGQSARRPAKGCVLQSFQRAMNTSLISQTISASGGKPGRKCALVGGPAASGRGPVCSGWPAPDSECGAARCVGAKTGQQWLAHLVPWAQTASQRWPLHLARVS